MCQLVETKKVDILYPLVSRAGDPLEFAAVLAAHGFFARPQSTKGYEIVLAHRREPRCLTENAKLPPVRDTFSEGKRKGKGKKREWQEK